MVKRSVWMNPTPSRERTGTVSTAEREQHPSSGPANGRDEPLACILRALLAMLGSEREQGPTAVVGEIDLDGQHYTITRREPHTQRERATLSAREREIAAMVARGYTNDMIASVLDISTWTVRTHMRRTFSKLGVRSRGAMIARLVEDGVVEYDPRTPDWDRILSSGR
jgi:DNA-binding CsgD family transcriptional regulator